MASEEGSSSKESGALHESWANFGAPQRHHTNKNWARQQIQTTKTILKKNNLQQDVSENRGTPKSSILIGFSIINRSFWGTHIFGNPQQVNGGTKTFQYLLLPIQAVTSFDESLEVTLNCQKK